MHDSLDLPLIVFAGLCTIPDPESFPQVRLGSCINDHIDGIGGTPPPRPPRAYPGPRAGAVVRVDAHGGQLPLDGVRLPIRLRRLQGVPLDPTATPPPPGQIYGQEATVRILCTPPPGRQPPFHPSLKDVLSG